jgi:hypothetical protein
MSTTTRTVTYVSTEGPTAAQGSSQPKLHQHGREIQAFGTVRLSTRASRSS